MPGIHFYINGHITYLCSEIHRTSLIRLRMETWAGVLIFYEKRSCLYVGSDLSEIKYSYAYSKSTRSKDSYIPFIF